MPEPPSPPPYGDWQSMEVGDAIRLILDIWESIGKPQHEVTPLFQRLGLLVQQQPEVVISGYSALFHAALSLPALVPVEWQQIPDVRRQIEMKVYADMDEMPPPPRG